MGDYLSSSAKYEVPKNINNSDVIRPSIKDKVLYKIDNIINNITGNSDEDINLNNCIENEDKNLISKTIDLKTEYEMVKDSVDEKKETLSQIEEDAANWCIEQGKDTNRSTEEIVKDYADNNREDFSDNYGINYELYKVYKEFEAEEKELEQELEELEQQVYEKTGMTLDEIQDKYMIEEAEEDNNHFGLQDSTFKFGISNDGEPIKNIDDLKQYENKKLEEKNDVEKEISSLREELEEVNKKIEEITEDSNSYNKTRNFSLEEQNELDKLKEQKNDLKSRISKLEDKKQVIEEDIMYAEQLEVRFSYEYQAYEKEIMETVDDPEAIEKYMEPYLDENGNLNIDAENINDINRVYFIKWIELQCEKTGRSVDEMLAFFVPTEYSFLLNDSMLLPQSVDAMTIEELILYCYLYDKAHEEDTKEGYNYFDIYHLKMQDLYNARLGMQDAIDDINELEEFECSEQDIQEIMYDEYANSDNPTINWIVNNNLCSDHVLTPEEYEDIWNQAKDYMPENSMNPEQYKNYYEEERIKSVTKNLVKEMTKNLSDDEKNEVMVCVEGLQDGAYNIAENFEKIVLKIENILSKRNPEKTKQDYKELYYLDYLKRKSQKLAKIYRKSEALVYVTTILFGIKTAVKKLISLDSIKTTLWSIFRLCNKANKTEIFIHDRF